jgi:type IV secretory pathway TrbL component
MRPFMVLVTLVLLMTAMLVLAGPASAQAGCQAFGTTAASEAQALGGLGEVVRAEVPVDDDVAFLKTVLCP